MKKEHLIKTIEGYNYNDLLKEQYGKHNLSTEEVILFEGNLIPFNQHMSISDFANKFDGHTLAIYYKDNIQVGFVRLTSTEKHSLFPLRTIQNIIFDIEHPEQGLLTFKLDEFRQ